MIPGSASIGGDAEELASAFSNLPFARAYKQRLLNAAPERVLGSENENAIKGILDYLRGIPKGTPGMEEQEIAPDVFSHIYRGPSGDPVGYLNREPGKVISLAVDPNASPLLKAKALMQLAKHIVTNRLDPGEMTSEGAAMLEKLRGLAKKAVK